MAKSSLLTHKRQSFAQGEHSNSPTITQHSEEQRITHNTHFPAQSTCSVLLAAHPYTHDKRGRHTASAACLPRFNIFGNIFPIVCYWLSSNHSGLPACSQQAFRIHSFCHVFTKHVRASSSECRACRSSSR